MEHPSRCGNTNLEALFKKNSNQVTSSLNQYLQALLL